MRLEKTTHGERAQTEKKPTDGKRAKLTEQTIGFERAIHYESPKRRERVRKRRENQRC
jgi:hypothetical protein